MGDNAQGKTNIIESIFISAFGKSFRTSREKELIKYNEEFLNINLKYKNSSREGYIKVQIADKKNVIVNGIKTLAILDDREINNYIIDVVFNDKDKKIE